MSSADGYVLGTTKIVDHGPNASRWDLVFVGDGYRASELTTYRDHVDTIVTELRSTPPFDTLFCGINVHRIDVVSTDSGADDPLDAPDSPTGTPTTAKTYFDATFAGVGPGGIKYDRLLVIDQALALTVANAVPSRNQVICVVNSTKYGGSGGTVATCSVDPASAKIAIHEIGHSAFGLADEYEGGAGTPPAEPVEPNVTRNTNRATNKWRALIAASTPMPSSCSPAGSCTASTCVPPGTAPPAGAVGTYEGGAYTSCNVYRPLPNCYMRDYAPFCPVCSGVIRATLAPYLPVETITLTTPSISFANVPAGLGGVGVTTHRAVVWETVSCRPLTFRITAGPTGGFGVPLGTSVTVGPDTVLPVSSARLWLSYTSTSPGDVASGSVTVRCDQTGQAWVIPVMASTVARPKTAVALVFDRSYSMTEDAGDGRTKIEKLREAGTAFVDVMRAGDGVGIVRFNQAADRLMEVEDVATGAGTARSLISGHQLDPAGSTSIGDGVLDGSAMLADANPTPPYDVQAMVVLTDGLWNRPPSLPSVTGSITARTFAVGLGIPTNISVDALATLCQGHDGYLLMTGQLTPSQSMRLSKYFVQILAGVTNAQVVTDPAGFLTRGAEHRIPFWITDADFGMDLIVLSPYPKAIRFLLESPDGTVIDPATSGNLSYVVGSTVAYYRCALPVIPTEAAGTHGGQWQAVLRLGRMPRRSNEEDPLAKLGVPYEFLAHSYSALAFDAAVLQSSFEPGAVAELSATVTEYEAPSTSTARVWAEIAWPGGSTRHVVLEQETGDRYSGEVKLPLPGTYRARIRARGETRNGQPFEREKTLTAVALRGGGSTSSGGERRGDLERLIECVRAGGAISDEGWSRLRELGFDLAALLDCLGPQRELER